MKSKYVLKEVETSETAKDYMGEQISVGDIVVIARSFCSSNTPSLEHGVVNKIIICRDPDSLEITDTRLEIKRIGSSISYRNEGDIVNFSYGRRKKSYILNILKI